MNRERRKTNKTVYKQKYIPFKFRLSECVKDFNSSLELSKKIAESSYLITKQGKYWIYKMIQRKPPRMIVIHQNIYRCDTALLKVTAK